MLGVKSSGTAFQLTTSQGGRQRAAVKRMLSNFFQLTTSQGGRRGGDTVLTMQTSLSTHDLTRRSTRRETRRNFPVSSFNSRPHKEVDRSGLPEGIRGTLSTHDLTRRSTIAFKEDDTLLAFQLTTSQGGRRG